MYVNTILIITFLSKRLLIAGTLINILSRFKFDLFFKFVLRDLSAYIIAVCFSAHAKQWFAFLLMNVLYFRQIIWDYMGWELVPI